MSSKDDKPQHKVVRNMSNNKLYYTFGYYPNGNPKKEGVYVLCELFKNTMFVVDETDYTQKVRVLNLGLVPKFLDVQEPPVFNPIKDEPNKASELYYGNGEIKLNNKNE